jgi:hypothetical protein
MNAVNKLLKVVLKVLKLRIIRKIFAFCYPAEVVNCVEDAIKISL